MKSHITMLLALVCIQCAALAQLNFPITAAVSPGGANKQIQFNNNGSLGGLVAVQGDLNHLAFVSQPASYTSSGNTIFKVQGLPGLTIDNPIVSAIPLQTTLTAAGIEEIIPTNAGLISYGTTSTAIGSGAAGVISGTNALTMDRRQEYTGSTAANSLASVATTSTTLSVSGSSVGRGFLCTFLCASIEDPSKQHFLAYLGPSSVSSSTTLLTNGTHIVGVGFELNDTNYSIFHNDGSGTVTKVSLGSNFPTSTASQAYLHTTLFSPTSSSSIIYYRVKNLMNGSVATGTLNTNLPANNVLLGWKALANNLSSGTAPKIVFGGYYSESY